MKLRWFVMCSAALGVAGCGGNVSPADTGTGGAGVASSSSTSTSTTSASTTASTGDGGSGAGPTGPGGAGGGTSGSGGDAGNGGGGGSIACPGIEDIVPSNPTVDDEDGDGTWSPGESATLTVTLTNTGNVIFAAYPGITMASDNPDVSAPMPSNNNLFGLAAGDSALASVVFDAASTVPSGTVVHFTATVNSLNQVCDGVKSVGFDETIE